MENFFTTFTSLLIFFQKSLFLYFKILTLIRFISNFTIIIQFLTFLSLLLFTILQFLIIFLILIFIYDLYYSIYQLIHSIIMIFFHSNHHFLSLPTHILIISIYIKSLFIINSSHMILLMYLIIIKKILYQLFFN